MMKKPPCCRRKYFSSHFFWWLICQTNIYSYDSFSVLPFLELDCFRSDYEEFWDKESAG